MVGQRVHLTEGGKVDLVLNDVHRTVAFARGPGTSAAEPAQLFQAGSEGTTTAAGSDSTPSGRARRSRRRRSRFIPASARR